MPLRVEHVDRIVGDALDEHAEALFAAAQLFLRGPPLGEVARDFREGDQIARRVEDRIDDHIGPEVRAVLAHAPPLRLEAAFAPRGLQGDAGNVLLEILRRVEAREMLADNLVGLIALEAPGARIPAGDMPLGIEHVDGIVGDALDQHLEPAARARRMFSFGHSPPETLN